MFAYGPDPTTELAPRLLPFVATAVLGFCAGVAASVAAAFTWIVTRKNRRGD